MLPDLQPDWGAVLVSGVIYMVLGMLWYGPLFGKRWMKAIGKTEKQIKAESADMGKVYGASFVLALVLAVGLNDVVKMAGATVTVLEGALLGLAVSVAFVATTTLVPVLYEGRSRDAALLSIGYMTVWLVIAGAMFAWWPAGWP